MKTTRYDFIAIAAALLIAVSFSFAASMSSFAAECRGIREKTLRLHILANSDSAEDQALKLMVRDRILAETGELFAGETDLSHAKSDISERLAEIQLIALDEISARGYDYSVNVELTNMFFTTRTYENATLPAGNYDALRVTIGEAAGKNWWCVLYPPLCVPAAEAKKGARDVLAPSEAAVVESSPRYEVRFKLLEWFMR